MNNSFTLAHQFGRSALRRDGAVTESFLIGAMIIMNGVVSGIDRLTSGRCEAWLLKS